MKKLLAIVVAINVCQAYLTAQNDKSKCWTMTKGVECCQEPDGKIKCKSDEQGKWQESGKITVSTK